MPFLELNLNKGAHPHVIYFFAPLIPGVFFILCYSAFHSGSWQKIWRTRACSSQSL